MTKLMNGINYLDMKEVAEKLKRKSVDAAARWCLSNNIWIMMLGNKSVVSEFEFRMAFENETIKMLKKKYGNDWEVYYEVNKNDDVKRYNELKADSTCATKRKSSFDADAFLNKICSSAFLSILISSSLKLAK